MSKNWPRQQIDDFVQLFLSTTSDLSGTSWATFAKAHRAPSSMTVANRAGGRSFSEMICAAAMAQTDQARSYTWPICPAGVIHPNPRPKWSGTAMERAQGVCPSCEERSAELAERERQFPTFAERHPHLIPYLADPATANSKGIVVFRCATCQDAPIRWSPSWGGVPQCTWCTASQGRPAGSLIERKGGGEEVRLEAELADALCDLGLPASSGLGILLLPRRYYVDIIKPDVVILDPCIAIEIDNHRSPQNRHMTAAGADDDQLRDTVLGEVGWNVLRIRLPLAPAPGDWPWRIETRSCGPKKLARLIVDELTKQGRA